MNLLVCGMLLILGGGGAVLLLRGHPRLADGAFRTLVVAGCGLAAIASVQVLRGGQESAAQLPSTLPGGPWKVGLDPLSAWFILLACLVATATTMFGVTYLAHERPHRRVAPPHATFALLVAAMLGVFAAQAVVPFLMAWELMALSAYFLIVFEHDQVEVRRAGMVYLVLTHIGTLALLAMFLIWGRSGSDLAFARLTPAAAHAVGGGAPILLLALIGFGIKAGVFPFHFWLPGAHASAPAHVSALLSGVMIKTGVYGVFRVLALFGPPPGWWAWTVLALGLASAVLGVLWALTQRNLKRALAFSSVDNIGIIMMGVGLGTLGSAYHQPVLAVLGYTAALLHVINHALFKSLLFLCAGAIVRTSGTLQLDRLGGLARLMPRTAWAFLLGSIAIVGLPPLNGFVGEWTLIRGFLATAGVPGAPRFAVLGASVVGMVGALTLACFVRLGTTVFLGQPRSSRVEVLQDARGGMAFGLALVGLACLIIGIVPGIVVVPALRVAAEVSSDASALVTGSSLDGAMTGAITILVASLGGLSVVLWGIRRSISGRRTTRTNTTWGCAYDMPTTRMQYTAASFSAPVTSSFGIADGFAVVVPPQGADGRREDRVLRSVAMPLWQYLTRAALALRPLQQGRVTTYLQYIIGTVLVLLGFLYFAGLTAPR